MNKTVSGPADGYASEPEIDESTSCLADDNVTEPKINETAFPRSTFDSDECLVIEETNSEDRRWKPVP